MEFAKVKVQVAGRDIEAIVRLGTVATVETGTHKDRHDLIPTARITIHAGLKDQEAAAWVQVAKFADGKFSIVHEGWASAKPGSLELSASHFGPTQASIELLEDVDLDKSPLLRNAKFGTRGCCTAYGNGCHITCCNACCSDPTGCPGASCCG
jgi:hypothetical protein